MKMEHKATINGKWYFSIISSFLGCLIVFLIFNHQEHLLVSLPSNLQQTPQLKAVVASNNTTTTTTTTSVFQQTPPLKPVVALNNNTTTTTPTSVLQQTPPLKPVVALNNSTMTTTPTSVLQQIPPQKPVVALNSNTTTTTTTISALQQTPHLNPVADSVSTTTSTTTSVLQKTSQLKPEAYNKITPSEKNDHVTTNFPNKVASSDMMAKKKCNIFEGRWVYDPKQYPRYNITQCGKEFNSQKFRCLENGRPESEYEKWRWEATDCHIPLLDGIDMLERLRNKRMVLVGDSLNRNQWVSLACFLYSSISDPSRVEVRGQVLKAKDYNFTLEFHWSAFLVELNVSHESGRRVLMLDKIADISNKWVGADVMVFNSWHWWVHPDKLKAWDVYEYKGRLIEKMERHKAFAKGMKTWATWMEKNVDPKKTTVVFRSYSEVHNGKFSCQKSTRPLTNVDSYESVIPKSFVNVVERQIKEMGRFQVKYLNITMLSRYRSDAHQSLYANLNWKKGSKSYDCGHWCVPGLPDTWNRLLYAILFFDAA